MKQEKGSTPGQTAFQDGQLSAEPVPCAPMDRRYHQGPASSAFAPKLVDPDRRLSVIGAFYMFIAGFLCGVFWTIILTWLF